MTYTLSNDLLTVSIQDAGAQLCSVRSAGGTEYLWQADPAVWGRHAPLLFPLIGRLQDSQYTLDGRAWSISTHGFARDAQFQVSEQGPTALSFQLEDSEETRRVYPFSFVLTVTYTLEGSRLTKAHRWRTAPPFPCSMSWADTTASGPPWSPERLWRTTPLPSPGWRSSVPTAWTAGVC